MVYYEIMSGVKALSSYLRFINRYSPSQIRHPENARDFSNLLSLSVLIIEYRLRGDVRKQAVM